MIHLNVSTFVYPDWGMLRRSRRVLTFLYTLRRAALANRTTTTYHIQQLCPKRVRRKDISKYKSRATTTYHIQQLCPMNDCNSKRESVTRTT